MADYSWGHAEKIAARNAEIAAGPIAEPPPAAIVLKPSLVTELDEIRGRLVMADALRDDALKQFQGGASGHRH